MIAKLPIYISLIFASTTIATLIFVYLILKNSTSRFVRKKAEMITLVLMYWAALQMFLGYHNIYNADTSFMPPKIFLFGVLPPLLTILILFLTHKGRAFIDSLPLSYITFLNVVRIPVELVLLWLFMYKMVPQLMTFEGRNFDILAGITAPFVAYFGLIKRKIKPKAILIWNYVCLALLMNIVVNALLSAPFPLQQFAFDQPNIAILYFPFNWLPTFIVPIVLFGHLVSIRQLSNKI